MREKIDFGTFQHSRILSWPRADNWNEKKPPLDSFNLLCHWAVSAIVKKGGEWGCMQISAQLGSLSEGNRKSLGENENLPDHPGEKLWKSVNTQFFGLFFHDFHLQLLSQWVECWTPNYLTVLFNQYWLLNSTDSKQYYLFFGQEFSCNLRLG